jgi:hypothetical protein
MGRLKGSGQATRRGHRAARRGTIPAALACLAVLVGAAPATAAPACASFHRAAKAKGLSSSVLGGLGIRRVCATRGAVSMEVDVTLSGDVNRTLAKSVNVAIGAVITNGAGAQALVVGTRDRRGRAHDFASRGLTAHAARRGARVSFIIGGSAVAAARRVDARVVFKKRSARTAPSDAQFQALFTQHAFVSAGGVALAPPVAHPPPPPTPVGPVNFGSNLAQDSTTTVGVPFDYALWLASQATGVADSVTAPADGQVTQVAVRGNYVPGGCAATPDSTCQTILFQDLRPQPDGKVKVMSTTQPFMLPATPGTYNFAPTNFFVKKGDYVALASIGGRLNVLAAAAPLGAQAGAVTDMFQGGGQDMNGSVFMSNNTQNGQLLNTQMTLKPTAAAG